MLKHTTILYHKFTVKATERKYFIDFYFACDILNIKIKISEVSMDKTAAEKQNIFDNEEFFSSYIELRNGEQNLNTLLEQPAMEKLLPALNGKSVLDLGCGYGHNCLEFIKKELQVLSALIFQKKCLILQEKKMLTNK